MSKVNPWLTIREHRLHSGQMARLYARPGMRIPTSDEPVFECEIRYNTHIVNKFNVDRLKTAIKAFYAEVEKEDSKMIEIVRGPNSTPGVNWEHFITPRQSGLRHEDFADDKLPWQLRLLVAAVVIVIIIVGTLGGLVLKGFLEG